jgi:hypothetical protein
MEWGLTTFQFLSIRESGESLAGRWFCSPYVQYIYLYFASVPCSYLFIYGLFDGAVIVSDDIASNPVHIGTPGCCNIRSIFYHRRLDILSVHFLQVFQLKFCIIFSIRATCPVYLFLICSQPWPRNCILDGALWYEILPFSICEADSEFFNCSLSTVEFFLALNEMRVWSSAISCQGLGKM